MKRPAFRFRQYFSLCLCCLLTLACLGLPASSAEDSPDAPTASPVEPDPAEPGEDTDGAAPDGTSPGGDDFYIDREPQPSEFPPTVIVPGGPDGADQPEPEPTPPEEPGDSDPNASPEPPAQPSPKPVKVRFVLHKGDEIELDMLSGQAIPPEEIPTGEGEELTLVGWQDENGDPVQLEDVLVEEDRVFTAQWAKRITGLFDLESHRAYVSGVGQGLFKPNQAMTRAEAASMFYSLLKRQEYAGSGDTFPDVPSTAWYASAVRKVHSLGLIDGYADGKFRPNRPISRAEFITIAAACDDLAEGSCPFTDLGEANWARPYIVSAYRHGWVAGDGAGKFNPNRSLTRAEAVTILNKVLGRVPDAETKTRPGVKNFYDVFPGYWAYSQIVEASTTHAYQRLDNGAELWTDYVMDTSTPKKGWIKDGDARYYVGADGKCVRGEQTIGGKTYLFDGNGRTVTGFAMKSGWKRYYKDGVMQGDISELGVVSGPYYIKVYKPSNYLIVFAKGDDGKYNIPVRAMITSCGDPTPTGTFYTPAKYRWCEMVGGSWAQWCTQISGPYLFHTVPNDLHNNTTMWVNEYNLLGTTRSLGCIRLTSRDAKWMYDNCDLGTQVDISSWETSGPMAKPTNIKLAPGHSWDPTDPTAYYLCQARGCH